MRPYEFKEALHTGKPVVGYVQLIPSQALTEMAGLTGFDWVWLDIEHGSAALGSELEGLIRTAKGTDMTSIVRVTKIDYSLILRCLELGANGVLVPRVRTRQDIEQVVEWVKYPPQGIRGYCGATRAYGYGTRTVLPRELNEETIVMLIAEQVEAFENLDDILSVPGVDCAIFGPGDLSLELGLPQRRGENDPEGWEKLYEFRSHFLDACRRHSVAAGEIAANTKRIPSMLADGVTVFTSSTDAALIQRSMAGVVRDMREAASQVGAGARL